MANGTDFDIVFFNGDTNTTTYARLDRSVENPYVTRIVRAEVQQNLLTQSEVMAQKSRTDGPAMYQTSWAAGARWWKPLIAGAETESYFQSNHMDTWSEPGKVIPTNQVADAANTVLQDNCVMAVGASGALYAVGFTEGSGSGFFDAYIWTPASNAFIVDTNQSTGVDDDDQPLAMTYDPSDGYFYIITNDPEICRFNPTTNVSNAAYIATGHNGYVGSNIFLQNQELMFYDGEAVFRIDKASTSAVEVFDDGQGPEFLSDLSFAGSAPLFRRNLRLGISTPEGIYYVKNTRQGPQPVAFIYRVDRDSAGNYIGNPIATLPAGSVALSIAHHLGSVVIAASPDWQTIVKNDTTEAEIILYHVTQGGMGALGSLLGGRSSLDETPYALLGSQGSLLYIGGQKRLWVYDAVRGGLHTAWTWATELADGAYVSMANVLDSAGAGAMIFLGKDRIARIKNELATDPDLVTNFGDDETHYTLESNYFDGGLPMETKSIAKVEAIFDPSTGTQGSPNQEWTVQISVDDGAFTDAINASNDNMTSGYGMSWVSASGRLFRYKLIYQTKTAVKSALKALMVSFLTGEMIQEWELVLDGSSLMNVDNLVVDPETFVASMTTYAQSEKLVAIFDNFNGDRDVNVTAGGADQQEVKVMSAEIVRQAPSEAQIKIVVREDPFNSAT